MTNAPMIAGLAFLPIAVHLGALLAPRQERTHPRVPGVREELARGPRGDDHPALGVEEDAVVADREDARELVRHDDHGRAQALPELEDQVVEPSRAHRIEPAAGSFSPMRCRSRVLLPEPLPPITTNTAPRRTSNVRSRMRTKLP